METDDNWFNGFPAEWNFVVPSLYLLGTSTWVNSVVVLFFCALTMTNIKFVHPVRVRVNRTITLSRSPCCGCHDDWAHYRLPGLECLGSNHPCRGPAYYLWLTVSPHVFDDGFPRTERPGVASESAASKQTRPAGC